MVAISRAGTTRQHAGFESSLERDRLVLIDFHPAMVGIVSPAVLADWHDGTHERWHAPDFFVRRADGLAVVVGVRTEDWIAQRVAAAFEVTRRGLRRDRVTFRAGRDAGVGPCSLRAGLLVRI